MPVRTLLRGGHIISMDPEIGDIAGGDVLIEDEEISAVAPSIDASDCEVVDASGAIIIPGFVDSHRHTWETVIRGIAPDVTLDGYFALILDALAPAYRPQDVYAGNLLGTLEAIDSGVTTPASSWRHKPRVSFSTEGRETALLVHARRVRVTVDGARHDLGLHDAIYVPRGSPSW